ncbi:MAG TPA: alpha/beta hydrolase [Anaeromyxobacteraceae bacterium]|nr:alpha/beta hydrolase [Anaeromyxobacteraceae bacterium]
MLRRTVLAALLCLALTAGCGGSPRTVAFPLGHVDRDLAYCRAETLDLYIPRAPVTHPLPVALYVHGGGLTGGDKSSLNPIFLNALASAGYAVASVNYRLAPRFEFPAQIEDVKCAIRYLRVESERYGLNGEEIFAFGTSAGGQLVALAALTGPHSSFDVGPYGNEPSDLRAVADMFGPANLAERASGFSPSAIQQVFGQKNHPDVALASPTHFVSAASPPILIVQGVDDPIVLESQSIELYRALEAVGDQTQLVLVQNMGHMFMQVGPHPVTPSLRQIARDVVTFFDNQQKAVSAGSPAS